MWKKVFISLQKAMEGGPRYRECYSSKQFQEHHSSMPRLDNIDFLKLDNI